MTASTLAELIGINEDSLLHIESGTRKPSYQTIYKIAVVLEASLDFLSGRVDKPNDYIPTPEIEEFGLTDTQAKALKEFARAVVPVIKKNI